MLRVILAQFWDFFASEGIKRVIIGYEFYIDTGDVTPVYCKKPHYGSNGSSVIMKQIIVLGGGAIGLNSVKVDGVPPSFLRPNRTKKR